MAGSKESPRQKMIGMMYLVLTALLAMNVSKDVLDAFIVVNNGLEKTNLNFSQRNNELYADFNLAKTVDPVRITPNWEKAQNVKKQSAALTSYIEDLKKKLIAATDGIPKEMADTLKIENIQSKDNYDIPTNIMIGASEDGSNGVARELKNKLSDYKKTLSGYILPNDREKVKIEINTSDPPKNDNNENWEIYNFFHRPLVADITLLSKMKNDIKNAEATVVDYLLKQVNEGSLVFDTVAAKVIPQSNYVLLGEEYKADLFLAAFNKTQNPEIAIGNYNETTKSFSGVPNKLNVEKGLGKYAVRTSREGIMTYTGAIKVVAPSGKEMMFPFKSEYIVAKPALTVSADKMNVFYIGLDNPVSVSVPGIPNERLKVSIDKGSITPLGNGQYNVKQNFGTTDANISVVASMENGQQRNMGTIQFRVKEIPKPFAKFAGRTNGGGITKNEVLANPGLIAEYQGFVYQANCKVTSFTVEIISAGMLQEIPQQSNMFNTEAKNRFQSLKKGEQIIFSNIVAIGPDNRPVKLNELVFKIK